MAESSVESLAVDRSSPGLQWGRDLSIAESRCLAADRPLAFARFNGAAISRSRNLLSALVPDDLPSPASMGPRSLDRGIPGGSGQRNATAALLQWGRDLSIAESASRPSASSSWTSLQWGRDLSIAESRPAKSVSRSQARCFNGAAISRSRNLTGRESRCWTLAGLQWGRDLSIAESGAQR